MTRSKADRLLETVTKAAASQADAVLAPLIEYDRAHGGDLVYTLDVYLRSGSNASRAAEELYLHRSGLLYRLSRIETLLAVRLDLFEIRVALEIAVLSIGREPTKSKREVGDHTI